MQPNSHSPIGFSLLHGHLKALKLEGHVTTNALIVSLHVTINAL